MIKDFIDKTRKENFLELVPTKDFYTSIAEINQASVDENGNKKDLDVVLSSVCVNERGHTITTQLKENTSLGPIESSITINEVKTDSNGNVLDQTGAKLKYYTTADINLTIQDATALSKAGVISLKRAALVYNKTTEKLIKVLPGIPVNLSEEFGINFINSNNMASRCKSIMTLLFGKNRLSKDWMNSQVVFLTPKGIEKINKAYEELRNSAESKETASFECTVDVFN